MKKKFSLIFIALAFLTANVPDFSFKSTKGKTYQLSELRGRLVYLNFFSENCYPCKREVPLLNEISKLNPDLLLVFGIGYNYPSMSKLAQSQKRMKMDFPVLFDPKNQLANELGVFYLPCGFLIDEQGKIKKKFIGEQGEFLKSFLQKEVQRLEKKLEGREIYLGEFKPINSSAQIPAVEIKNELRNILFQNGYMVVSLKEKASFVINAEIGRWIEIVEFHFWLCTNTKKPVCYEKRVQSLGANATRYLQEIDRGFSQLTTK